MVTKLTHTPTDEQAAVISAVAEGASAPSVMVDALAGCTKSTTLEMAAPTVKVPALGLAFNKRNADELRPRMPGNFKVATFNGLGHGAMMRAMPQVVSWGAPDEKKLGKLVSQVARDHKVDLSGEQWNELRQLVQKAQQWGLTPGDQGRPLILDTDETWLALAEDQWLTPEALNLYQPLARAILAEDIRLVGQGVYSFDDQVWFSACVAGAFPKYPMVFVDESQDLSPLNHAQLALSNHPNGRLVVVGDPKQAIYAFRGADADSMAKLEGLRPSWTKRPLLTTFRCPKVVVARQQEHAPGYRAWHSNPEGRAERLYRKGESLEGWTWADVERLKPFPSAGILVLCRNMAPLMRLAFRLIRAQIGCQVAGRDIGKALVALSRKIVEDDGTSRDKCAMMIRDWAEGEVSLALANGHEEKVASIHDRAECLQAVLQSGARDAGELRALLERLFQRNTGVMLSTGHRAKGSEEDLVLILDPWRIPSRYATEAAKRGDSRQLVQEYNLRYVMETRTKHVLVEGNLEDCEL